MCGVYADLRGRHLLGLRCLAGAVIADRHRRPSVILMLHRKEIILLATCLKPGRKTVDDADGMSIRFRMLTPVSVQDTSSDHAFHKCTMDCRWDPPSAGFWRDHDWLTESPAPVTLARNHRGSFPDDFLCRLEATYKMA